MIAENKAKQILLVDDDEEIREVLNFDLKRRGFEVRQASGGRQALAMALAQPPDLVLSDMRMPEGDGVELLRGLREALPQGPRVIILSEFSDINEIEAYHLGADALLAKPFQRSALFAQIQRSLDPLPRDWRPEAADSLELECLRAECPDLHMAVDRGLLRLGRGGLFWGFPGFLPDAGSKVNFQLRFEGERSCLQGKGMVRWTRPFKESEELPAGCGIEFENLDGPSASRLEALSQIWNLKPYIPKA